MIIFIFVNFLLAFYAKLMYIMRNRLIQGEFKEDRP